MMATAPKAIILDFDGTIVESVGIKDEAFKALFAAYPDDLNEIMRYHLSHNATIRFEKFRHIHEHILKLPFSREVEERLGQRFSEITLSKIVECPIVAGAREFLDHFSRHLPLFLASVSPSDDLGWILEQRDLKKFFKRIYAYPWQKTAAIRDAMQREGISASELLFIGDSPEDLEAAREAGVPFIGRQSGKWTEDIDAPLFRDFIGIQAHLRRLNISS
jgi:phosphoglycolate phosphatase-like HAD superfamily hydrolase